MIPTLLLILGWIAIAIVLLATIAMIILICAASTLRCKNCGGFHEGEECQVLIEADELTVKNLKVECDSPDWRSQ